MLKKILTCDECGAERRDANHWFVYERTKVGLHFHTWEWAAKEWTLEAEHVGHLCGQQCGHKLLDRFLTEVTTPK